MKIEDIDDAVTQYHALEKAVWAAAKQHLKAGHSRTYAHMNSFYVHKNKVCVEVGYHGSYSGSDYVELLPEEIAFFEHVIKVDDPTGQDETDAGAETMIAEIKARVGAGKQMSIKDTDLLFNHLATLPAETQVSYARKVLVGMRLMPNIRSKPWNRFVQRFVDFLLPA